MSCNPKSVPRGRDHYQEGRAVQKLIQGIHRFQSGDFLPLQGLFQQLAKGQNPETLFITCSDSRIDPNLLTQSRPGDLFILRNAGNIVPPYDFSKGGEAATIEFAVVALGVRDIIVCGHSHCGAMKGLLQPDQTMSLPALSAWLAYAESTRRIIQRNYGHLEGNALVTATVEENVLVQLENLRTHPTVAERLTAGNLHLHGWVYKIETGEVFAYDVSSGQFVPLAEYKYPASEMALRQRTSASV
jgi:carbonic anhydrase